MRTYPYEMDDVEFLFPREVPLGGTRAMTVRRTLPHKEIRTVGAWCFLDDYGPTDYAEPDLPGQQPGMEVPPHPHTGLQTVTWLVRGEVLHHDSVGSAATIRPGQLNLMTAGHGIAHSEQSVMPGAGGRGGTVLHGVQVWVALPDAVRHQDPHFEHHSDLPQARLDGADVTVVMGTLAGLRSPAATYSPIVAAQVRVEPGGRTRVALDEEFEHAVLTLEGSVRLAGGDPGTSLNGGPLAYLPPGRDRLDLAGGSAGALLLLLGGGPFTEPLLMWWNFVARTHKEIVQARADWEARGGRFGVVRGYPGPALSAPALPTTPLKPRTSRPVVEAG